MKKIYMFFLVSSLVLAFSVAGNAKTVRFGIKAGADFSNTTIKELNWGTFKNYTGFNAGILLNIKLPLGFALQPEVLYTQTGIKVEDMLSDGINQFMQGSIEVPIALQWGIQLGPVRPYVAVIPHLGGAVLSRIKMQESLSKDIDNKSPFQYGIGIGAGIDIWKFQISFRYKWGLNKFEFSEAAETIMKTKVQTAEVSLAFLF